MIHVGSSIKMPEIKSRSIQLLFESPPYEKMQKCCEDSGCLTNFQGKAFVDEFKKFLPERLRVLSDTGSYVLNFQAQVIDGFTSPSEFLLPGAVVDAGFHLVQAHHWSKPNAMPFSTDKRLKNSHEYFWHFAKTKDYVFNKDSIREPHLWKERDKNQDKYHELGKDPGNVFSLAKTQNQREFGIPKMPADIASRFIKLLTCEGDLVLDGFSGSGQTGVEALALGRKFIGYELHSQRAEEARQRLGITGESRMTNLSPWMNTDEVAAYTGLKKATIYSKSSLGEIPVHKGSGSPRYHREEIDLWMRGEWKAPIQNAQNSANLR